MQHQEFDNQPLRQYLLGDLDEEARIEIEARLLLESDYQDQLLIAEDELIEDYISDALPPAKREQFEQHYLPSPDAERKVEMNRALQEHANRSQSSGPKAAHAGFMARFQAGLKQLARSPIVGASALLLVAAISFGLYQRFSHAADLGKAAAALNAAYAEQRPVEVRLSGFDYAPHPITLGGEDKDALSGPRGLARDHAAKLLLTLVAESPSAEAHHWLGRYYLTQKDYQSAIEQFDAALKSAGSRAPRARALLHSDFAAALLERAKFGPADSPTAAAQSDLNACKTHLDEALRLAGNLPEALFNLGLLYQEQQLWPQAKETWEKYLQADPNSNWRADAERNKKLCETKTDQAVLTKDQVREQFLQAYQEGNDDRAWEILSQNREATSERLIWWQLADEFLQASLGNQPELAVLFLRALEYAGKLEADRGQDLFVITLFDSYRKLVNPQKQQLIEAHNYIRQGHASFLNFKFHAASSFYEKASAIFIASKNLEEELFTEYWLAYCLKALNQSKRSLKTLFRVNEITQNKRYLWLQSQALNTIGSIKTDENDYTEGIKYTESSLAATETLNDLIGQHDNLFQLANHNKFLNNYEEAVKYLRRCLKLAELYHPGQRQMWVNYDLLAQVLSALAMNTSAADYQAEAIRLASGAQGKPYQRIISYAHLGIIYGRLQKYNDAINALLRSFEEAKYLSDFMERTDREAYAHLQLGHLHRQDNHIDRALSHYKHSIASYNKLGMKVKIYEARKGVLQCYLTKPNLPAIQAEMKEVLSLAEKYRLQISLERQRDIFFDREQNIFDLALDFNYSRRLDSETAFNISETYRSRSLLDRIKSVHRTPALEGDAEHAFRTSFKPMSLSRIRGKLPTNSQIIQYALLEDKIIIWVISHDGKTHATARPINMRELHERITAYLKQLSAPSQRDDPVIKQHSTYLHGILISPIEKYLEKNKQICIVPDKILSYIPFGALTSPLSDKPAVAEYTFTYSPSSTVFILCTETARLRGSRREESLLAIGNPAFNRNAIKMPYIPWAKMEAMEISSYYQKSWLLVENAATESRIKEYFPAADVIHLAAHNIVDKNSPNEAKIILANDATIQRKSIGDDGVLQGREIHPKMFPRTRLVVLSACRSGVEHYYQGEGMIGMARNFLAANIPIVVASLWSVETSTTSNLMIRFHQQRKLKGLSAAEALRQAQLEMMNHPNPEFHHPAYWAGFVLLGGYANY
jgi:CHAT domain-containing protein